MIWRRGLSILAAVFFVVAFALAVAHPSNVPLGQVLARVHPMLPTHLRLTLPVWVADHLLLPLLLRPAWLVPLALALICAAGAVTMQPRKPVGRTRPR